MFRTSSIFAAMLALAAIAVCVATPSAKENRTAAYSHCIPSSNCTVEKLVKLTDILSNPERTNVQSALLYGTKDSALVMGSRMISKAFTTVSHADFSKFVETIAPDQESVFNETSSIIKQLRRSIKKHPSDHIVVLFGMEAFTHKPQALGLLKALIKPLNTTRPRIPGVKDADPVLSTANITFLFVYKSSKGEEDAVQCDPCAEGAKCGVKAKLKELWKARNPHYNRYVKELLGFIQNVLVLPTLPLSDIAHINQLRKNDPACGGSEFNVYREQVTAFMKSIVDAIVGYFTAPFDAFNPVDAAKYAVPQSSDADFVIAFLSSAPVVWGVIFGAVLAFNVSALFKKQGVTATYFGMKHMKGDGATSGTALAGEDELLDASQFVKRIRDPIFPHTPVVTPSKQFVFQDDADAEAEDNAGAPKSVTPVARRTRAHTPSRSTAASPGARRRRSVSSKRSAAADK